MTVIDTITFGRWKEWSARIALRAGFHPIRLQYDSPKGEGLVVKYSGPGIEKQTVPEWALYHK